MGREGDMTVSSDNISRRKPVPMEMPACTSGRKTQSGRWKGPSRIIPTERANIVPEEGRWSMDTVEIGVVVPDSMLAHASAFR